MARKDEFEFDIPDKKEKKEKPQREEKESKPLFGEGSFLSGLFKKSSSDFGLSFDKEEKENSNNGSPKRLKWWHILLIVLGAVIIIVGIVVGIILGQINNSVPGGIGGIIEGGGELDEVLEPDGIITSVGTFLPNDTQEYILCEYTEYFSGEKVLVWKNADEILFDGKPYYVLVSDDGRTYYSYSYEYNEAVSPEETRHTLLEDIKEMFAFDDEQISHYDVHIYKPVSFTRVNISEVTLTETDVTVKYSAGAVDGEMSEEYTLTGTYTKVENDYTFTYTNLPEDENLLRVAENLLGSAKYESYVMYNSWINELTFGDGYNLTLVTPTEE